MPETSNNSFIPKRNPAKKNRNTGTRKIYAFSIFSYTLIFATLVGSAGVFLYDKIIQQELNEAVVNLDEEITSFDNDNMERVAEFDRRLSQAKLILNNSVSLLPVFSSLEQATINTVWLKSLDMKREDGNLEFTLSIETDSFDSTIFQRGRLVNDEVIGDLEITNVDRSESLESSSGSLVTFNANLDVPLSAVPFTANNTAPADIIIISEPPADNSESLATTSTDFDQDLDTNQADI